MLVTKDGHNDYLSVESFSLISLSGFVSRKFVISSLRSFEAFNACDHCVHQQCCLLVTKDGHYHHLSVESFSLTFFSEFAASKFVISGLRNSEAYNAFSHLFHEQCRLLVTKDGHNHYISIESLVAVVFLTVGFSKFLISGLRIFEEYNGCYHFIHQQCFLLVTKDGHNHYLGLGSFVDQFRCLLLAFSWILVGAALKQKLIFTLLLINSVVCMSPKAVTMIIFQSKVFHWHLCQSLLLANSWFLVYESLSGKCFSPLYSSSVLSVSHQRWSQPSSFSRKFFADLFCRVRC